MALDILIGVVTLSANASREVVQDVLQITFNATAEGKESGEVQVALNEKIQTALATAKVIAKGSQVQVQTGGFSVTPSYDKKANITGWHGNAQLVVKGTDHVAISELVPRIKTMTLQGVDYSISRKLRERTEAKINAEAIETFLEKAKGVSMSFGFDKFKVVNAQVNDSSGYHRAPRGGARMMAMSVGASLSDAESGGGLATEAGREDIAVTINGSIQLGA